MIKDHGLVGPDWICQKEVEFKDPANPDKTYRRKLDAYNTRTKQILEIKSNGSPDRTQIPKDLAWAKDPNWKDSRVKYVFAEPQKTDAKKFLGTCASSPVTGSPNTTTALTAWSWPRRADSAPRAVCWSPWPVRHHPRRRHRPDP